MQPFYSTSDHDGGCWICLEAFTSKNEPGAVSHRYDITRRSVDTRVKFCQVKSSRSLDRISATRVGLRDGKASTGRTPGSDAILGHPPAARKWSRLVCKDQCLPK